MNAPEGNNPQAQLWGVANATHNWMDEFAKMVLRYFENPSEAREMEVRMTAVSITSAVEEWHSHWS